MPVSCKRRAEVKVLQAWMAVIGPGMLKSLPELLLGVEGQMILEFAAKRER